MTDAQKWKKKIRLVSNWFTPRFCQPLRERVRRNNLIMEARRRRVNLSGGIYWNLTPFNDERVRNINAISNTKMTWCGIWLTQCKFTENKTSCSLGSRTINTNISSYLMVHDFSETILCDAINFKHKIFILNNVSNEFLRENYCQTKHSNSWKEKRKQVFD